MPQSEIRESTKSELLNKVRTHDYGQYLFKASIAKIRGFNDEEIIFDFPVTALIGPNGSGKSSVLGAAGCAYKDIRLGMFFPKSMVGDESMSGWRVEYDLIDKGINAKQLVKRTSNFRQAKWFTPCSDSTHVEYLIDVAERKSIQTIFTTHSDYALAPVPSEAIWACISGKIKQGKLSVEALRAVSGRVDKKLAVFVEDAFAKAWVDAILREKLGADFDQIEVHAVHGDGNAVSTHNGHTENPSINFKSLCVIDGDSQQLENIATGVFKLPGKQPELEVFTNVYNSLNENLAILTVSCQRPPDAQEKVRETLEVISHTNRDPHLIFNQIGIQIGFVSELIIRGAFLALWVRSNENFCNLLAEKARELIGTD